MNEDILYQLFDRPEIGSAKHLVEEYAFTLEGIPETVRLRVYQALAGKLYEFEQRHYLQPPGHPEPLMADTDQYVSAEEALRECVELFIEGYQKAHHNGHPPDSNWLLPNRDFSGPAD